MTKINSLRSFSLIVLLVILNISCNENPPIPEEKFIKVYVDLLIIQDTTTSNNFSLDSVKTMVLTRHNITEKQYNEMINYYNSEPENWIAFFDSTTAYVEMLKKNAENQP
jgi:hypothetical protein